MGTIVIEEYTTVGGAGAVDSSPVANLSTCVKTTVDQTTSISVESITLQPETRFIVVSANEVHRVSLKDSTVTSAYARIDLSGKDYALNAGDRTLYYRLDA